MAQHNSNLPGWNMMLTLSTLQTLYSLLCKVQLQVGSPSFAEDCKRLQQAKEEIENALSLHNESKT